MLSSQQIIPFISQEFTISVYSILLQKQIPSIDTYLFKINTDGATYPTPVGDGH